MPYREDDAGRVILEMSRAQYQELLIFLGMALSVAHERDRDLFPAMIAFINSINEGNPRFTPYKP